jgi:hypothetical protein
MISLLLALVQGSPPTVGDTIWIVRSVEVPVGAEVRPGAWDPGGDVELLGHPRVERQGNQAIVSYPAVAWRAGTHTVLVPGPIIIGRDGITDSLPLEARSIEVASVLPQGQEPERLAVQPEAGLVEERVTSPGLLVASVLVALGLFLPLAWWWRRRGPPMTVGRPAAERIAPPVAEWLEAGEPRAVAACAARALRTSIAARVPGMAPGLVTARLVRVVTEQRASWPAEEMGAVLRALEAVKFAEVSDEELVKLTERADELGRRIEGAA